MFPSSTPSYQGYIGSETLQTANNAAQLNQMQATDIALANKLGTGASTPTSTSVLVGNGTGTSAWGQVALSSMVSGVLPTTNGGTGTTSTTGTGSNVFGTSPTITNPTESGGTYNSAIIPNPTITYNNNSIPPAALETAIPTSLFYNPYKFSVYRNAAQNIGNAVWAVLQCDTKTFDTSSNVDVVTNKGRFTAPIAGFYQFSGQIQAAISGTTYMAIALFKNGSQILNGTWFDNTAWASSFNTAQQVSGILQLAANDYVEVQCIGSSAYALTVGSSPACYFQGFLVSAT